MTRRISGRYVTREQALDAIVREVVKIDLKRRMAADLMRTQFPLGCLARRYSCTVDYILTAWRERVTVAR